MKMFCKKGLAQNWAKSLEDICVVLSFCFTQKAAALQRMNSFACFFEGLFIILSNLFVRYPDMFSEWSDHIESTQLIYNAN